MPLEEARRRNRRWLVVIAAAAVVNYGAILSLIGGLVMWDIFGRLDIATGSSTALVVVTSAALGLTIATAVVAWKVREVRHWTVSMLGAEPIALGEFPMIDNLVDGLAIAAGTAPVRTAILSDDAPNAMAIGPSPANTTIVITTGLVEKLTRDEIEAVLAVEVCAIRRLDTALHTMALACAQGALSVHNFWRTGWKDPRAWVPILVTWPSMAAAEWLRAWALSAGDFGADEMAIAITRHPEALDRALQKLDEDPSIVEMLNYGTAPLWFEPVPHRDPERAAEFRGFAGTPSLRDRRSRLPHIRRSGPN